MARPSLYLLVLLAVITVTQCEDCFEDFFQCVSDGKCIPGFWVCDKNADCVDASDEKDPTTGKCPKCPAETFQCANGRCMPGWWVCDEGNDCGDWSDERDPSTGRCPTCPINHLKCANGRCVPNLHVCDGTDDCGDGSDERPEQCVALNVGTKNRK